MSIANIVLSASLAFGQPAPNRGVLCLTFDDRNFDSWRKALPILDEYGAHATFFICGAIDENALSMMKELQAHGHSIGFHGATHARAVKLLKELGEEGYLEREILPQIKSAESAGFRIRNWGYPFSVCNRESEALLARYFDRRRTGRIFGRDPAKRPLAGCDELFVPVSEFRTQQLHVSTGIGSGFAGLKSDVSAAIKRLAERDEALVLYSHAIRFDGSESAHDVSAETLKASLEAARECGVRVLGFDEIATLSGANQMEKDKGKLGKTNGQGISNKERRAKR